MPEGGVFPDTIFTDGIIDWKDLSSGYPDSLKSWLWGSDEFYNGNITDRSTPWLVQICDGQPCIEPMFRMYSRFDWVDDLHQAAGDPDWPYTIYSEYQLAEVCGSQALNLGTGRTKTTGQVTGAISYKMVADKPGGRGDVIWGFDPYRFDNENMKKVIHWMLGEHFGLLMRQ
jgi:hypothetical protein